MCSGCRVCAELKAQICHPTSGTLIKAIQPMERLSMDFKGSLSSASRNTYIVTIVDEFSHFLFAFPSSNMNSVTVIKCLNQLFTVSGYPSYVHSDHLFCNIMNYLTKLGVATSKTKPYHPTGNG